MSRNLYRQARKDHRRATRNAVRNRKAAFLCPALAIVAALAGHSESRADGVTIIEKTPAGMESPFYTLAARDAPGMRESILAMHLSAAECFPAAVALAMLGKESACLPMGRIASLED